MTSAPTIMHPSVAASVARFVAIVRKHLGTSVERIVIHGSALRPLDFVPGKSDVDLVVLVGVRPESFGFREEIALEDELNELTGPWSAVAVVIRRRDAVELLGAFELCYEGSVTRGEVVFDSGTKWSGEVLERTAAKEMVVARRFTQAKSWMRTARILTTVPPCDDVSLWESCRATCWALHGVLLAHEVSPAKKHLRWNLPGLFELALQHEPMLAHARVWLVRLPADLSGLERGDLPWRESEYDADLLARDRAGAAAAWRCIRTCERLVLRQP